MEYELRAVATNGEDYDVGYGTYEFCQRTLAKELENNRQTTARFYILCEGVLVSECWCVPFCTAKRGDFYLDITEGKRYPIVGLDLEKNFLYILDDLNKNNCISLDTDLFHPLEFFKNKL